MSRELNWESLPNKYQKKAGTNKIYFPLEEKEQMKLAEYLDWHNYCWYHVPNEGLHKVQYRKKQKKLGLKKGVPDNFIFDIPDHLDYKGIVIELKRQKGGQIREGQKRWLDMLNARGWLTQVCCGADEAIDWLEKIFEGVPR